MLPQIQGYSKIFKSSSRALRELLKAGKGKEGIPPEIYERVVREWGVLSLKTLGVSADFKGTPTTEPALFVGNHVSYIDIPLLMSQAPVMFVAKKEIGSWPLFGTAVRKLGMVLVERDSDNSRNRAAEAIRDCILKRKQSMVLFPSGTTCVTEKKAWRWGAFLIAKRSNIPIQPFRINYEPLRALAYIDDDLFVTHLWRVLGMQGLRASLEFHPPVSVGDPQEDCLKWWEWSRPIPSDSSGVS